MMHLIFIGSNSCCPIDQLRTDNLVGNNRAIHSVAINDDTEWAFLQQVFSLQVIETSQRNVEFKTVMKLQKVASSKQPSFDQLYEQWLELSHRENSMDEYGQLLFLVDGSFWQAKHIYVIEE